MAASVARKFDNDMELSEILNFVKNKVEAKERSFRLSHPSNQYADYMTTASLVDSGTKHKAACFFAAKIIIQKAKCMKMSDPKACFFCIEPKKLCFICFKGGHLSANSSKFKDCKCKGGLLHVEEIKFILG